MAEMNAGESMERFSEGLKKASSRARELGAVQMDRNWNKLAFALDNIRQQGEKMFGEKPLTEQEVTAIIERREKETNKDING